MKLEMTKKQITIAQTAVRKQVGCQHETEQHCAQMFAVLVPATAI